MSSNSSASDLPLRDTLNKLASYEPQEVPVVSLYLNLAADDRGRDKYEAFIRKAFSDHGKTYPEGSPARASLDQDLERITAYLSGDISKSTNGLALFSSSGHEAFFEALQLDAPLDEHWFFLGSVPHLYPLAKVIDQYPRYASVLLDTNSARIFVFSLGGVERREHVQNEKTRRSSMGGWSQARYQRRADNMHLLHVKEVVDTLERIVRKDNIQHIIVAGDDVVVPLLKAQLPKALEEKLVDVLSLEKNVGEDEIVQATLEVLRQKDAETDAEHVEDVIGNWRGSGLGVMGPEATLTALQNGQVEELIITGSVEHLKTARLPDDAAPGHVTAETSASTQASEQQLKLADELVTRAQQTGARVRFIENADLLKDHGGVGAKLRYRI